MIKREAQAIWKGSAKEGKGQLTTPSGVLKDTSYSFAGRFEKGTGTNPEELIGAAHAGCFAMAFTLMSGNEGFVPDEVKANAVVNLDKVEAGWTVTEIKLTLQAKIPKISKEKFQELAQKAKAGCPISRLLNTKISLDAKLV